MDHFSYRDGSLYCEDAPIARIVESVGTALEALTVFLQDGAEKAMHALHTRTDR